MTKITTTCCAGNWRTEFNEDGEIQFVDLPLRDALLVWGLETIIHPTILAAKELAAEAGGTASITVEA